MSSQFIRQQRANDSSDELELSTIADLLELFHTTPQFTGRLHLCLKQLRQSNALPISFFVVIKKILSIEAARCELLAQVSGSCDPTPEQIEAACDMLFRAALAQSWLQQHRHAVT